MPLSFPHRNLKRALLPVAIVFLAAGSSCLWSRESPFYKNFSMRELVTSNKSIAGFDCSAGGGGGDGNGIGSRSGGIGGKTHFQSSKGDAFFCRLKSGELASADEEKLIGSLR